MERATLSIEGMSCGHCVGQVKSTLQALPGVTVTDVSIGRAEVIYDALKLTPHELAKAVSETGYEARLALPIGAGPSSACAPERGKGDCGCG